MSDLLAALTPQEREAVVLAETGRSISSIAQQMGLSQRRLRAVLRSATDKVFEAILDRQSSGAPPALRGGA